MTKEASIQTILFCHHCCDVYLQNYENIVPGSFTTSTKVAKNHFHHWMTCQLRTKGYFWLLANSLMCLISKVHLWMSCSSLCSSSPRAETSAVSLCLWLRFPSTSNRLQPLSVKGVRKGELKQI